MTIVKILSVRSLLMAIVVYDNILIDFWFYMGIYRYKKPVTLVYASVSTVRTTAVERQGATTAT